VLIVSLGEGGDEDEDPGEEAHSFVSQSLIVLSSEQVTISLQTVCDQSIPYIREVWPSMVVIGREPF